MPTNLFADVVTATAEIEQSFTPTVGQTQFVLTVAPTNAAQLKMHINGVDMPTGAYHAGITHVW